MSIALLFIYYTICVAIEKDSFPFSFLSRNLDQEVSVEIVFPWNSGQRNISSIFPPAMVPAIGYFQEVINSINGSWVPSWEHHPCWCKKTYYDFNVTGINGIEANMPGSYWAFYYNFDPSPLQGVCCTFPGPLSNLILEYIGPYNPQKLKKNRLHHH